MLDYSTLIVEEAEELERLARQELHGAFRDRLRFLIYLKTKVARSQSAAGKLLGLGSRQSQRLWQMYQEGGLSKLLTDKWGKHWGRLTSHQIAHLLNCMGETGFVTQAEARDFIHAQYGVSYSTWAVGVLFKRLGVKLKTGRPTNIAQEENERESFKKTLVS